MSNLSNRGRIRLAGAALIALLLAMLASPTFATAPGGGVPPAGPAPAAPAAAYTLHGDAQNTSGTGSTTFLSTYGSSSFSTWFFRSNSATAGTTTLGSYCDAPNCTSISGQGQSLGVSGVGVATSGIGVYGLHDAIGGTVPGVRGVTHSTADNATAVQGIIDSYGDPGWSSTAVLGTNTSIDDRGIGVWGFQNGSGWGVYGSTTGAGRGVYGTSAGVGVYGTSSGTSGAVRGVYGRSDNGQGVYGLSTAASSQGVRGGNSAGIGVYGSSMSGTGGVFHSINGDGLHATSGDAATYALATGGGSSYGNAYIDGDLHVTGTCCTLVRTDAGLRQMYATEATRDVLSDEGTASLVNGRVLIPMDPLFAQAANLHEEYQVFLTPHSADTPGLAAINLTASGFEVRELKGGQGSFKFSWRVDAVRRGSEQARMAPVPAAPTTPILPSETPDPSPVDQQGGTPK